MEAIWKFQPEREGGVRVETYQDRAITHQETGGDAAALVRETIQNSLDAADDSLNEPVIVRFKLSDERDRIPPAQLKEIIGTLEAHLEASGTSDLPDFNLPAPYLVLEDFNTTGLLDDPMSPVGGFGCFFRAVGFSHKTGKDIGRHGLGKAVFMKISRIRTYFGLTVRNEDERQLLMGQSPQRYHKCGDNPFEPYGLYGICEETGDEDGVVQPVEDEVSCEQFKQRFGLGRTTEPGLSVVILYPEEEITADALIKAIIDEYFFVIIKGDLVVTVQDGRLPALNINSRDLKTIIAEIDDEDFKERYRSVPDFVRWALDCNDSDFYQLKEPLDLLQAARWNTGMFSEVSLEDIGVSYERGDPLAFKVPVKIQEKGKKPQIGWFKVFLQKGDSQKKGFRIFIRERIKITLETKFRKGIRGLALIDEEPLTSMLGDAENIAHTSWDKDQPEFRGKYSHGSGTISFVKDCFKNIPNIIRRQSEGLHRDLFADYFPVPPREAAERRVPPEQRTDEESGTVPEKERIKRRGGGVAPPPDIPQSRPAPVRVEKIENGFVIRKSRDSDLARKIIVKVAYDTRGGNPFSKYQKADFDFSDEASGISITGDNYEIVRRYENTIEFKSTGNPFEVRITGFDRNRDVVVDAKTEQGRK